MGVAVNETAKADPVQALPMNTAPRDGTMLRLLVQFEAEGNPTEDTIFPAWTIGHNDRDNTGDEEWQIAGWCWSHDHYTEGKGEPVGWLPMMDAQAALAQQAGADPTCPATDCGARVLYECPACSRHNYPPRAEAPQPAIPEVDLEQFRPFVQSERDHMSGRIERCDMIGDADRLRALQAKARECDRLLALIDAQHNREGE